MMISPDTYAMMCKNKSYRELIKERDSLVREIRKLEKIVLKHDMTDESWMICPSPEVQYHMSLEYLSRLCLVMCEREDYS